MRRRAAEPAGANWAGTAPFSAESPARIGRSASFCDLAIGGQTVIGFTDLGKTINV